MGATPLSVRHTQALHMYLKRLAIHSYHPCLAIVEKYATIVGQKFDCIAMEHH
jgi:hypothetical protein